MIRVNHLTRKYGATTAVDSVSFEIEQGQIVGLLGHNGAGKTTTLKMLTGVLDSTSGHIEVDGLSIEEHGTEIQKRIGYLSEASPLYPDMTVWQYLTYVARMRDVAENEIHDAVMQAMLATDLTSKVGEYIHTLSKGYCQRVGVAQAIVHKPDILILDEPTNGLDPTQIHAMRDLIRTIAQSATVIISTHIMQEVEAICDRVIIIRNGRIAIDSPMKELQKKNAVTLTLRQTLSELEPVVSKISGVAAVSPLDQIGDMARYSLELDKASEDLVPELAKAVVAAGWPLYGISRDHRDLETVFREVHQGVEGGQNA